MSGWKKKSGLALPTGKGIPILHRAGRDKGPRIYILIVGLFYIVFLLFGVWLGFVFSDPKEISRRQAQKLTAKVQTACTEFFVDPLPKRGRNVFHATAGCQYLGDLVLEGVYGEGVTLSGRLLDAKKKKNTP